MTVYLLHFLHPRYHAQHYIGYTESKRTLAARLEHHRTGTGAKYMRNISRAMEQDGEKLEFVCARIWKDGTRTDERRLKNQNHTPRLCPICRGEITYEEAQNGKTDQTNR